MNVQSPSMPLYGTLSLFRTSFPGCYAFPCVLLGCDVSTCKPYELRQMLESFWTRIVHDRFLSGQLDLGGSTNQDAAERDGAKTKIGRKQIIKKETQRINLLRSLILDLTQQKMSRKSCRNRSSLFSWGLWREKKWRNSTFSRSAAVLFSLSINQKMWIQGDKNDHWQDIKWLALLFLLPFYYYFFIQYTSCTGTDPNNLDCCSFSPPPPRPLITFTSEGTRSGKKGEYSYDTSSRSLFLSPLFEFLCYAGSCLSLSLSLSLPVFLSFSLSLSLSLFLSLLFRCLVW